MGNAAILLAGGSGSRMRGTVKDKVLEPLLGLPVILHSFKAFLESQCVSQIVFVSRDGEQAADIKKLVGKFFGDKIGGLKIDFAMGGAERQDSVLNGLEKIDDTDALAFIHDGARPLVGAENIRRLAEAADRDGAAVLAARVVDTIKRVAKNKSTLRRCALADLERRRLWAMQTPQVFRAGAIRSAYGKIRAEKIRITDDVAAAAIDGIKVSIVENGSPNPKITLPEDIAFIEFSAQKKNGGAKNLQI